eukprot:3023845-Amphidinium_carterae.1
MRFARTVCFDYMIHMKTVQTTDTFGRRLEVVGRKIVNHNIRLPLDSLSALIAHGPPSMLELEFSFSAPALTRWHALA